MYSARLHVFAESNFLYLLLHQPHKRERSAADLWERFERGDVMLHVPFLCFQEARNRIVQSITRSVTEGRPYEEIMEIRRYLRDRVGATWDDAEMDKFYSQAQSYLATESSKTAIANRVSNAYDMLESAKGIIHADDEVFASLPLDVEHELDYNDHLVLASVLRRARSLATEPGAVYFCSRNTHHFAPELTARDGGVQVRRKLLRLYEAADIEFLPDFVVPRR